jgi:cold shock protein
LKPSFWAPENYEAVAERFSPGSSAAFQGQIVAEEVMPTGTVKWFNEEKRFGFITPDEGGQDLFVHQTGLIDGARALPDGEKVEFEAEDGPKGPKAVNVKTVA